MLIHTMSTDSEHSNRVAAVSRVGTQAFSYLHDQAAREVSHELSTDTLARFHQRIRYQLERLYGPEEYHTEIQSLIMLLFCTFHDLC